MEQLGLVQALGSLAETVEEEYANACRVELPTPWPGGDDERDTAIYHVARESSLHAARGGASEIVIRLSAGPASGELIVSARDCPPPAGTTVMLLRERAARIGGTIEIASGDAGRVVLTTPFRA